MAIEVPSQLKNKSDKYPLVNAKDNQIAGLGYFTSTDDRDNLPRPKRTPSFIAVMSLSGEHFLCQFVGDVNVAGDWELGRNWPAIANEVNVAELITAGAVRYNEVGSIGGWTNSVVGDFNQDGSVNIDDFLSFLVSYVNTDATSTRTSNTADDRVNGHVGNTGAHLATWEFENYDGTNDFMLATTKAIDEQIDSKITTKDLFATNRTLSTAVAHTLSAGLTFRDSNSQSLLALGTGLAQIGGLAYPMSDGTPNQVLSTNGSGVLQFRTVTDGADGSDGANGTGFTGGSYDSGTGVVTFTSNDGLGFSTGDLRGADGADGADGTNGQGVPVGGSIGQVIVKTGTSDYAASWGNMPTDPIIPLANVGGRYMWSSTDDGERVFTGNTVYGPHSWYSFSNEPLAFSPADEMRSYSGSEQSGVTTGTIYGYYPIAFGIKNPYTGKKVRVDYSFRIYYSGSTAPAASTPFGISLWSSNANTTGTATSLQATYRAESDDHGYANGTSAHHHGSFTTASAVNDDYLYILAEHRASSGLNGTTYMPANISIYMVD